ncbi:MAG: hypothetical protein IE925_04330 [Rhodobacterales bacterium]|nr:hypothetical protein [Rhodobacterales bacterium]
MDEREEIGKNVSDVEERLSEIRTSLDELSAKSISRQRELDKLEGKLHKDNLRAEKVSRFFSVATGALFSTLFAFLSSTVFFIKKEQPEAVSVQVKELAELLSDASERMTLIEAEIQSRQAAVTSLEERAANAEAVSSLNGEQLAAVNSLLRSQIDEANRSSFWSNVGVTFLSSFVFFVAGMFSPAIARKLGFFAQEVSSQ